jgi:hypothetical protein
VLHEGPSSSASIVRLAGAVSKPPSGRASEWLRRTRPGPHLPRFVAREEAGDVHHRDSIGKFRAGERRCWRSGPRSLCRAGHVRRPVSCSDQLAELGLVVYCQPDASQVRSHAVTLGSELTLGTRYADSARISTTAANEA